LLFYFNFNSIVRAPYGSPFPGDFKSWIHRAVANIFSCSDVYKILTDRYCKNVKLQLELHQDNGGHNLKLVNSRCNYDLRKHSFAVIQL